MDLIYYYSDAFDVDEQRHAQLVLKELGISYKKAIPLTISDSWEFIDCENVPEKLPPYLSRKE